MEAFEPRPDTARAFRDALGRFTTGVTLVTCQSEIGPIGITANSFASVSLDPPLVLWSPSRASRRFEAFTHAKRFSIHVLAAHQRDLASAFVSDGQAWNRARWTTGPDGTPQIDDCLVRFDCAREAVHDGGDHAIVLGRVLSVQPGCGAPLVFVSGRYGNLALDQECS